jgi:REP element-mobilizing transposase RayT
VADQPLAYFITYTTYGTWLHGDERGSVDDRHNAVDTAWIDPDPDRYSAERAKMTQDAYRLDAARRAIVLDAIVEECRFRGWDLLAAHVRTNHVHMVIATDIDPVSVMTKCKAHASRRLNSAGFDGPERNRWTFHGSTKYLWRPDAVAGAVDYTLNRQDGRVMERHEGQWQQILESVA